MSQTMSQTSAKDGSAPALPAYCEDLGRRAKQAARALATTLSGAKDQWLRRTVENLHARADDVLKANAQDMAEAEANGLAAAQIERLRLTSKRLEEMANSLREIAALP